MSPIKTMALAVSSIAAGSAFAANDFGVKVEHLLHAQSQQLFGITQPLAASAQGHVGRAADQDAYDLIELAHGLKATILTREAGNKADMFSFYPSEAEPTHMVFCIEGGDEDIGPDGTTVPNGSVRKMNPSVQTIDMESGEVKTILRGMNRCDGIRTTAWGTILATEETGSGQAYEIIDPLGFEGHTVVDRLAGIIVDPDNNPSSYVAKRDALPTMAWEGLTVLENGVVIGGDELRPGDWDLADDGGDDPDVDGGAIFKFIPHSPFLGGDWIDELDESPLVTGATFAFRASCREGTSSSFDVNYGQGCEIGNGSWVEVNAATARLDANNNGATGYYRPEDLHADPTYTGTGVRFCWANTGREAAQNYGEVICGIDYAPLIGGVPDEPVVEGMGEATVAVNRFVEGDEEFNSLDNLAFQPHTGNLYVIEDHKNGDVFACLPDGADQDIKTDGCVRVLSVKDQSAEPTGFEFTADGKTAILAIQHSGDDTEFDVDDYGTDDIVVITGFKVK